MRIDSSGNVGIGITPNVNSSVVNVIQLGKGMTLLGNANDDRATMAANLYLDTGTAFRYVMDGLAGRFSIEDGNMVWGTASSGTAGTVATVDTKMTLLNNGKLGIGGGTIEGKLSIDYTAAELPTSGTTSNSAIQVTSSLNNQLNLGLNTVSGSYGAYIQASDNNLAVPYPLNLQPNGGNVGIGTSSPTNGKLEVQQTATTAALWVQTGGTTSSFTIADFRTGTNAPALAIKGDGNVGIGTDSPGAKLHVNGFTAGQGVRIQYGNSSGTIEAVNFKANGGNNGVIGMQMVSAGVGDLWLGGSGGRSLTLYRDGNVRDRDGFAFC